MKITMTFNYGIVNFVAVAECEADITQAVQLVKKAYKEFMATDDAVSREAVFLPASDQTLSTTDLEG